MRKNLRLDGKALSPIFATLIILAVVTVLFIPVFIWASGLSAQTTDSWVQTSTAATELIAIEEVSITSNKVLVYVRNVGVTTVSFNDVLIADENNVITTYQVSLSELATVEPDDEGSKANAIIPGELMALKITALKGLDLSSDVFTVKVFTTKGIGETYTAV